MTHALRLMIDQAITLLYVHGIITESEKNKARIRFVKKCEKQPTRSTGNMAIIEIKTQAELDKAIADGATEIKAVVKGEFTIDCGRLLKLHVEASLTWNVLFKILKASRAELWGTSRAELWGTSSAVLRETSSAVLRETSSAVLWETSSAVLWETSSAELWGTSSAVLRETSSAVLWETSSAVLWETSSAELWGTSSAVLSGYSTAIVWSLKATAKLAATCHAFIKEKGAKVTGGKKTFMKLKTALDWCNYYGVEVKAGVAILYKSINKDFTNPHNRTVTYTPGTKPAAADWDGGKAECGGGLHFSPCVSMALEFHNTSDARYVACPVRVSEMAVHFDGSMPQKCKAKRVYMPLWEVDRFGEKIKESA